MAYIDKKRKLILGFYNSSKCRWTIDRDKDLLQTTYIDGWFGENRKMDFPFFSDNLHEYSLVESEIAQIVMSTRGMY